MDSEFMNTPNYIKQKFELCNIEHIQKFYQKSQNFLRKIMRVFFNPFLGSKIKT